MIDRIICQRTRTLVVCVDGNWAFVMAAALPKEPSQPDSFHHSVALTDVLGFAGRHRHGLLTLE